MINTLKITSFLLILSFASCQNQETFPTTFFIKKDLISRTSTTPINEESHFIGGFVTKTLLKDGVLYFKEWNNNQVDAYIFEDSLFISYTYEKRPIEINDFDVTEETVFLFSARNSTIICFDKTGKLLNEIQVTPTKFDIEHSMGEVLFHYNARQQVFYIGLKPKNSNKKGIETVGMFDLSGNLVSTFGDFAKDNSAAVAGYIMSNDGMKSKFIGNKLYVLKKETSNLYCFNEKGGLFVRGKLSFKAIPGRKKERKSGESIIKDQVMDFYVMEKSNAICYTYITDTGDFMGQKSPSKYLAYRNYSTDSVLYTEVDFMSITEIRENEIFAVSKDKERDRHVLLKLELNL